MNRFPALTGVSPFRIDIADAVLTDLRDRLARTRWPDRELVDDWSQGIPLAYTRDLASYWLEGYDWRAREAALNDFAQFTTVIDGLQVHFIHQRSARPDAFPLMLTHGWPGSVAEFQRVIDLLTDPVSFGGRAEDAFHVVCPSLPGFGFSGKPLRRGWGVEATARAWRLLMGRLGYERYGAQGGDWGAVVTAALARDPGGCVAIHLNMPVAPAPAVQPATTGAETVESLQRLTHYQQHESGYQKLQATRPQTIGYALTDSPVAQMSWIIEKFGAWMDCGGHPERVVSRDILLDNVMLYWVTASGPSSARLYWESSGAAFESACGVTIPTGIARYPREIITCPRSWCEQTYNITRWTDMPRGGHFPALEQPELFVADVRDFFRSVR